MQRTYGGELIKYRNKIEKRHVTSSSGVKSLTMLNSLRISSGVLPLIMLATVLQPTSLHGSQMSGDERNAVVCKNAQKSLDIEIVGGKDNFEKHLLINGDELLIPLANVSCSLPSLILRVSFCCRKRLSSMMLAVVKDLGR